MSDVRVGVNITGRNGDLLRAIAGSRLGLQNLRRESTLYGRSTQDSARHARDLNRALRDQRQSLSLLSLRFTALREAMRTLALRTAITGFTALAATVNATGVAVVNLTQQIGMFASAAGVAGVSALSSLVQGFTVAGLAFNDVGKALMKTGEAQEKAIAKLTKPAREFVREVKGLKSVYRDLQVVAQKGVFPGVVKGMQAVIPVFDKVRNVVYDTGLVIGYLAEKAGKLFASRAGDIYKLGERNVVTFRRMGDAALYVGEALIDVFRAADPFIGHVTRGIVSFSRNIRDAAKDARKDGGLASFFYDLRQAWDSWTSILGSSAKIIFNVFKAINPVAEEMTGGISKSLKELADWTGKGSNQKKIRAFFERAMPTVKSMVKLLGAVLVTFVKLGDRGNKMAQRMFDGLRKKVLPVLEDILGTLGDKMLPVLADIVSAGTDLIKALLPGLHAIGSVAVVIGKGFAEMLRIFADFVKAADGVSPALGAIASVAVASAVIASWRSLRLAVLGVRQAVGLTAAGTPRPTGEDFRKTVPPILRPFTHPVRTAENIASRVSGRTQRLNQVAGGMAAAMGRGGSGDGSTGGARRRSGVVRLFNPDADHMGSDGVITNRLPGGVSGVSPTGRRFTRVYNRDQFGNIVGHQDLPVPYAPRTGPSQSGGPRSWTRTPDGRRFSRTVLLPAGFRQQPRSLRTSGGWPLTPSGMVISRGVPNFPNNRYNLPPSMAAGVSERIYGNVPASVPRITGVTPKAMGQNIPSRRGPISIEALAAKQVQAEMNAVRSGFAKGIKDAFKTKMGNAKGAGSALLSPAGGAGGIAAMLAMIFGPGVVSNAARDMSGTTPTYKLPKTRAVGLDAILPGNPFANMPKWLGGMSDGEKKLKHFGDTAEQTFKKLAQARDSRGLTQLAEQARSLGKEFPKSSDALNKFAQAAEDAAVQAAGAFRDVSRIGGQNLAKIKRATFETGFDISQRLGSDSRAGKEALAKNFRNAADAIKQSMKAGKVSTKTGLAEIRSYMKEALALYGIKGKQADNYIKGRDTVTGKSLTNYGSAGASPGAATGYLTLGRENARGRDSIPMMLNGNPVIAAEGENVAVFNRHQRKAMDSMLSGFGFRGMRDFFSKNKTPHHMASGGGYFSGSDIVPVPGAPGERANRSVLKEIERILAKYPALRLTDAFGPNHSSTTHTVTGTAADFAGPDDVMTRAAYALAAMGYKVLYDGKGGTVAWPGHGPSSIAGTNAHLHVELGGAGEIGSLGSNMSSLIGMAMKHIKSPKVDGGGTLGNIVQGALNKVTGAANAKLDDIAGMGAVTGSSVGGVSREYVATLMRRAGFPESAIPMGLRVVAAESSFNPTAANPSSTARGLWQILLSAHPEVSLAEANDPWFATRYAYKLWRTSGWNPWEAFTAGRVAMGLPPRGGDAPESSSSDTYIPGDNPKKQAAAKKKNKKTYGINPITKKAEWHTAAEWAKIRGKAGSVKYPTSKRPSSKPAGLKLLAQKPASAARKALSKRKVKNAVAWAKAAYGGKFKFGDIGSTVDPLTGQQLDIDALPALAGMKYKSDAITRLESEYSILDNKFSLTDEAQTITTLDAEGNEVEVVNWNGGFDQSSQTTVGGINQHVEELKQLIQKRALIKQAAMDQKSILEGLTGKPEGAIKERRARLRQMKRLFDKNVAIRKATTKKLSAMDRKDYDWRAAVDHNEVLLRHWRDYKREGDNLPASFRKDIDTIMDRLRDTNKDLRKHKPKGGDIPMRRRYADDYNVATSVNRWLIGGDGTEMSWQGGESQGGRAGVYQRSLAEWAQVKDYRDENLGNVKTTISNEDFNIAGLVKEIETWSGTKIRPPQIDGSGQDSEAMQALKDENRRLRINAINSDINKDIFSSFIPLLQGRMVGSFAHGGVIPETGMALVHKDEYIVPDPDGAFRRGMNSPSATYSPNVTLIVGGDIAPLLTKVEAMVDGKVAQVSTQVGSRSRLIGAAPGGNR